MKILVAEGLTFFEELAMRWPQLMIKAFAAQPIVT